MTALGIQTYCPICRPRGVRANVTSPWMPNCEDSVVCSIGSPKLSSLNLSSVRARTSV